MKLLMMSGLLCLVGGGAYAQTGLPAEPTASVAPALTVSEPLTAQPEASPVPSCTQLSARAMEADIKVAMAAAQSLTVAQQLGLSSEAIQLWTEAQAHCDGRGKERAKLHLEDDQKQRAALEERAAAGSVCENAQRDATSLQELGRQAFGDRRFREAASLFQKTETMWELTAEQCSGPLRQRAERARAQAEIDAHNAEFCAPAFERAREHTQKMRATMPDLSIPDKQAQLQIAETLWRDAVGHCRGEAATLAGNSAQALARERGTPWVASQGATPPPPGPSPALPAPALAQPVAHPVLSKPVVATALEPTLPTEQSAPKELDVQAGDTRYRGQFVREDGQFISGTGRVEWLNGDAYEGQLLRSQRHGQGVFVWANGQRYQGAWERDKPVGRAKLSFANGNQYEGEMQDGVPQGQGRMVYAGGEQFEGPFYQGQPHGKGVFAWKNGQRYEGEMVSGRPQGQGVLRYANGNVYEGPVVDGQPQGRGKLQYASGDSYEGDFVGGFATGQGRYAWKSGDRYEGAWAGGKKHGQGVFYWSSGDRWEGLFKDDERLQP